MLVTPEIDAELNNPSANRISAAGALDTFRAGHLVTVTRARSKKATFKLMEDVDEVWAMAFRIPRSTQRRLLGRFVEKDVFVGLGLHSRHELAGKGYVLKAQEAINKWGQVAGAMEFVKSANYADYIGHVVRDLDEDD